MSSRTWRLRDHDPAVAATLAAELGLLPTTARVLAARGIDSPAAARAFLEPSLDELHSPFSFVAMEPAVERLLAAIHKGERIVVHGDYDVDGITGTVVLLVALRAVGAEIDYLVPHRLEDGYGLKPSGIERAHAMGAKVVIAVDCGITAHDAARRAGDLGIDLIVADHHEPGAEVPAALAMLNPRLPDAGYPETDLAAVGVAFKLARGVLERHPKGFRGTALLKLVALGTVADLVPLSGENRVLTWHGLATLGEAVNPGLRALMELAGVRSPVSATDVGFRLAPRINAAGRLGHPRDAVEMFMTADPGVARRLAKLLHDTNTRRRQVEAEVLEQALAQRPADGASVVVVHGVGWHRGVIGIVASRLVETWGRPAVVIAVDEDRAFGSARSIPGFSIVGALAAVGELLVEYGGHPQAAGLQLSAANVAPLCEALAASRGDELERARRMATETVCDAELLVDRNAVGLANELERLAPFGVGNPRPRLLCRDLRVEAEPAIIKEQHVKLRLGAGDCRIEAVAWRRPELAARIEKGAHIDAVAKLKINYWNGAARPQLELEQVDVDGSVTLPA
ncbi:MAG TPA: single-stranded-DNA-specific exonuclease RecJ [Acidobacteriota bacterium]